MVNDIFEYKGKYYKKAELNDTTTIISNKEIDKIKPQLESNGACLKNAYITAKVTNSKCVEGFVFCMVANGNKVDDKVIRHCWNKKNEQYFDLTKDFVWTNLPGKVKDFIYFIMEEYQSCDYEEKIKEGEIAFLSDVGDIAKDIDDSWQDELRKENN